MELDLSLNIFSDSLAISTVSMICTYNYVNTSSMAMNDLERLFHLSIHNERAVESVYAPKIVLLPKGAMIYYYYIVSTHSTSRPLTHNYLVHLELMSLSP